MADAYDDNGTYYVPIQKNHWDAMQAERKAYRQALVSIVEHYHYPGGHETPAYKLALKALSPSGGGDAP